MPRRGKPDVPDTSPGFSREELIAMYGIRYEDHHRYGRIPRIPMVVARPGQPQFVIHWWDPTYEPPMPVGAVRGDITKQNFCLETPYYFYVDKRNTCIQCRQEFLFSAQEQKYWYESLGFSQNSLAVRCKVCRRQRRSEASIRHQVSVAKAAARAEPRNPTAHVEVARTLFTLHTRLGAGRLDDAIAAARKAIRLNPRRYDALFWEAACQQAAGRKRTADKLFAKFIELATVVPGYRSLVSEAHTRLKSSGS